MKNAIVFNCSYNGLSIIQELGKVGIKCFAFDTYKNIGTYSRYAKYVNCPDPVINERKFIDFLYKFCENLNEKPIVFPTNDEWVMAISKSKKYLEKVAILSVSEWDVIDIITDKDKFYNLGEKKNYFTPKSWSYDTISMIGKQNYPIIAKPKFKSKPDLGNKELLKKLIADRLVIINNDDELNKFIQNRISIIEHFLFQEYIRGLSDRMFTVGVYANKGELKGIFSGRKVRGFPADIGDCIIGESYKVPDYIIDKTKQIVTDFKYTGIAEFEYKQDEMSGKFYLIEINPRSWSWIGITPYCGVNLPLIAFNDLNGEKQALVTSFNVTDGSIKYAKIINDFMNSLYYYRKNHSEWYVSFLEWIKSIKSEKLVCAEFSNKDYYVAIRAIKYKILIRVMYILFHNVFVRNLICKKQ